MREKERDTQGVSVYSYLCDNAARISVCPCQCTLVCLSVCFCLSLPRSLPHSHSHSHSHYYRHLLKGLHPKMKSWFTHVAAVDEHGTALSAVYGAFPGFWQDLAQWKHFKVLQVRLSLSFSLPLFLPLSLSLSLGPPPSFLSLSLSRFSFSLSLARSLFFALIFSPTRPP